MGDRRCCCGAGTSCCGRFLPGPDSLTGALYYPLDLYVRFTAQSPCGCSTPVTFVVTWEFTPCYCWKSQVTIDMGPPCNAPPYSAGLEEFIIVCNDEGCWYGAFYWGYCNLGNLISFELEMTKRNPEGQTCTPDCNIEYSGTGTGIHTGTGTGTGTACVGSCNPVDGTGYAFLPQGLSCCGAIYKPDSYAKIELWE